MYTTEFIEYIEENLNSVDENELENEFCDLIDEDGPVILLGLEYCRSQVLKDTDPIAFRCAFNDFTADGHYVEINNNYYLTSEIEDAESDFEGQVHQK